MFVNSVKNKYAIVALKVGNFTIPEKLKNNFQIVGDIKNIHNWKAKVILGNNGNIKRGDWDEVGYVGFKPSTGTLIPIARCDEHHTGHDLLDTLKEKGVIPKGNYVTIWVREGQNYAEEYEENSKELKERAFAYKKWLELGGPDLRVQVRRVKNNRQLPKKYMSFSDFVNGLSGQEHPEGSLTTYGKQLVSLLEKLAVFYKKAITSQKTRPPLKEISDLMFDLAKFVEQHRSALPYYIDPEKVQEAASNILNGENLDTNMKIIFGFDGLKNGIHKELKVAIETPEDKQASYSYKSALEDTTAFFGDPKYALDEFNRLSAI